VARALRTPGRTAQAGLERHPASAQADTQLRVLHVIEAFGSGTYEVVRILSNGLAERDMQVAVAHGHRPETPTDARGGFDPRVELVDVGWERRNPAIHARTAVRISRLIRDWRPDVVHLHSSFAGVVGAASRSFGHPVVYTPHAYAFMMPTRGAAQRAALRGAEWLVARRVDVIGAISQSEARTAARELGARNVRCVPNGIPELDEPRGVHAAPTTTQPLVVAMGRMEAQQLPHETIRILSALRPGVDVAWIGAPVPGSDGERAVREAGIPCTGWLPRADALDHLGHATAYLHWTAWDGFPLSILEAVARNVVVVARDLDVTRELLGPQSVCTTEAEAVGLVSRLVGDPEFRQATADDQRARLAQFGAQRMVDGWLAIYGEMLGRASS